MNVAMMIKATTVLWILIVINLFGVFPTLMAVTLDFIGTILLVVHLLEYIVVNKKIKAKESSAFEGFYMTMLYGFLYWKY